MAESYLSSFIQQPLYEDVLDHGPIYGEVLHRSQQHNDSLPAGREKEKTTKRIKDITDRWQKVNRTTNERHEKLSRLYPCVIDYHENTHVIEDVIKRGESLLKTLVPFGVDVETGKQHLHDVRVCIIA